MKIWRRLTIRYSGIFTCIDSALFYKFLKLDAIKENIDKMKNEEEVEHFKKELEDSFSGFYTTKKNVQVSVAYEDKFTPQILNINLGGVDVKNGAKGEVDYRKIQLLSQVD